jgi:Family of unknown function (DUF6541)
MAVSVFASVSAGRRRGGRIPWLLAALPLLGIARLVPAGGPFGLWLRLLAATLVVLLPGRLVARALGLRGAAAAVAWAFAAVAAALAVTFGVHSSLGLAIGLLGAVGLAALPFALRHAPAAEHDRGRALALLAGLAFGIALWHVAGVVHGDGLFHLGRVRKLDELGGLSLRSVDEFRDGGLHPGYAFPLWHGFLALVARLGGVDPAAAVLHEPTVVAPLAFAVLFESGVRVFRSAWLGGAVLLASVALYGLAPGGGGSFATLAVPATIGRQVLVPALVAVFFALLRSPSWPLALTAAALSLELAFVHPTYALFLAIPLVAFVVVRFALVRRDLRAGLAGIAAVVVPTGLVVAWLAPIVGETASHDPTHADKVSSLRHYATELVVASTSSYHLRPEAFARAGAVAVAALVLVPLAGLAARRRWAALVLGGFLALLAIELSSWAFPRFADAVSLSQARRAAGFVPFAVAFAGGAAVLSRTLRLLVLPVALAAGIVLQLEYPGDFGLTLGTGNPSLPAWIALAGGVAALMLGLLLASRREPFDRRDWLPLAAALLFVLPVAVHGFRAWNPLVPRDGYALTPGLVSAVRAHVPERGVVYADLETSYRLAAFAPVYVANAPPAHVADTKANRPYQRRDDVNKFFETGNLAIPRRYGATWLVVKRARSKLKLDLPKVYADKDYVLYRLPA